MLAERRKAEEGLAEAAGRHEEATAALYRMRSAVERLELRRERAEETAAALRADADRPRLPTPPKPPSYERALTAAGAWVPERVELAEAVSRLEQAHAERRDALVALSGGESWFAAGAEAAAPAPEPSTREDALRSLAELAERAAALAGGRRRARRARWSPPLRARVDAGGSRAGELGEELRRLGGLEAELRRAASEAAERLSAVGIERARLEAEREEIAAPASRGRRGRGAHGGRGRRAPRPAGAPGAPPRGARPGEPSGGRGARAREGPARGALGAARGPRALALRAGGAPRRAGRDGRAALRGDALARSSATSRRSPARSSPAAAAGSSGSPTRTAASRGSRSSSSRPASA